MRVNDKNCPLGTFTFCAIMGTGILNEKASTRKKDVYEFKVNLEMDEDKAGALMDEIDDHIEDEAVKGAELVKVPYQTHDDYEGVPKGKVWLSAKALVEYEDKKTGDIKDTVINVYDSNGDKVKLPEGKGVGNGSTGIVIGNVVVWDRGDEYGATLWLSGIQIGDYIPYDFEDAPTAMEGGSFKGFNDSQLAKDETPKDDKPARRSSRRNRDNASDDDKPARRSSRRNRDNASDDDKPARRSRR